MEYHALKRLERNDINPFRQNDVINNIMEQVKNQGKVCCRCIARQTCMHNVCPVTIFQEKQKRFGKYCENNITFRLGILKKLVKNMV